MLGIQISKGRSSQTKRLQSSSDRILIVFLIWMLRKRIITCNWYYCSCFLPTVVKLDVSGTIRHARNLKLTIKDWTLPLSARHQLRSYCGLPVAIRNRRRTQQRATTTKSGDMSVQKQESSSLSSSSQNQDLPKVIIIAGPTGTGKSDVAASICDRLNGIIVSADSVQVYDKVQIGANKPTSETLQRTPHILLNIVNQTTPYTYNTAEWRRDALFAIQQLVGTPSSPSPSAVSHICTSEMESLSEQTISEDLLRQKDIIMSIEEAKRVKDKINASNESKVEGPGIVKAASNEGNKSSSYVPVVVGGTMMYVQWLVHGRPDAVRPTEYAAQQAQQMISQYSLNDDWIGATQYVADQDIIFQQQVQKLFPNDWYRLRRILEVAITVTEINSKEGNKPNVPISQVYSGIRENGLSTLGYDVRCFFLCPDDRMKHTKIVDLRCEQMIVRGLLNETTNLVLSNEMPDMVTRAIGYRQSIEYLQRENPINNDVDSFNDYVAKFTAATRQYSQRQMKWFRRENEFLFVPVPLNECDKEQRVQDVAHKLISYISMSKEEYDIELCNNINNSPLSESYMVRSKNTEQAKGMKVYQLEKQILCNNTPEILNALAEADACTQRFREAAKQKRKLYQITTTDDEEDSIVNIAMSNDRKSCDNHPAVSSNTGSLDNVIP